MRVSCGNDVVCCLNDSVKRRVSSDRHVGSAEVVVDRSDHTNNVQMARNIQVKKIFTSLLEENELCIHILPFHT